MIAQAHKKTSVRHDLYAVKVFGETGPHQTDYVLTHITRSRTSMQQTVNGIRMDRHRSYPLVDPKVVHPRQWEVDAFLAYGNHIQD